MHLDFFHCLSIFVHTHIAFRRSLCSSVYLKKRIVTFETLYLYEVKILGQCRKSICILACVKCSIAMMFYITIKICLDIPTLCKYNK